VVEALVAAANDAGGRDNVTAVYAEMPRFAEAVRQAGDETAETSELPEAAGLSESAESSESSEGEGAEGRGGALRHGTLAVVRSRITWFFAGMLLGVVGALALMFYVAQTQVRASQTLVVGAEGTARFSRIMDAVSVARPGDVVVVEPGTYEENVLLASGIDLVARVPLSVTIRRPATADAATAPLTLAGALNARVSGIRVEAPADRPADAAIRIAGPAGALELIEVAGPFRHAFVLSPSSSVTLHGGRVASEGSIVIVPDNAQVTFVNSVFTRATPLADAPISAAPTARLALRGNVFSGYGAEIVRGLMEPRRREILDGNLVVPAEQPRGTAPAAGRGRGGRGR
jgi:hypothetical protein